MRIRSAAKTMQAISEVYNAADRSEGFDSALEIALNDELKDDLYNIVDQTSVDEELCVLVVDKYGREVTKKHVLAS